GLADKILKTHKRQMKQLKSSGNPLEKHLFRVLHRLILRPSNSSNLSHRREAVIQCTYIAIGFPWITPSPVNAEATLTFFIFSGHMGLIVSAPQRRAFSHIAHRTRTVQCRTSRAGFSHWHM